MASVNEATEELIKTVDRTIERLGRLHDQLPALQGIVATAVRADLEAALQPARQAFADFDTPGHVCPLCGQAKEQTALLELLGSMKSCEVWGDDGQSWTINVASCDGNLDEIVGLMTAVKRGEHTEYTGDTE